MSKKEGKNSFATIGLWVGIFIITIAVVAGLAITSQKKGESGGSDQSAALSENVTATDHVRGNPMSRITLVEYSDFQCPACGAYYPLLKQLDGEYGNRIQSVYRNFPLSQIHKHALLAAQAAEAAGKQGTFFEMHDLLFEHQTKWPDSANVRDVFLSYADQLKLDRKQFEKDMDSAEVKAKIDADQKSGIRSGIQGTPTFFLNGKKIDSPRSYDEFKQLIDKTLSDAQ